MAESAMYPRSLTHYFDAHDDYRSVFGWICGYSADASFLNQAVEHFTREAIGQRAARGSLSIALMLDPSQPAINPVDVPGLAHLPILQADSRPFRLLHAKVALLAFRHHTGDGSWMLRLIVSTGNWTRQTLEESLDLGWCIEVMSSEFDDNDDDLKLRCADISAAWSMFESLHKLFDLRVLKAGDGLPASSTQPALTELATWLELCGKHAGKISRFFDNRSHSLLKQLPGAVEALAGAGKRNYLAMGSGFFEGSPQSGAAKVPSVLERIISGLTQGDLLTKSAGVDIYVNPVACQAVAPAFQSLKGRGWNVRPAAPMEDLFGNARRALHAKFLFGAKELEGNNVCRYPWVYLGSGNLTGPGFASPMSRNGGNLEAGVVFAPKDLEWYPGRGVDPQALVTRYLPIQWDSEISTAGDLQSGVAMTLPGPSFVAPPVAWLVWRAQEGGGCLCPPLGSCTDWKVLAADSQPCQLGPEGCFSWVGTRPRQVRIHWTDTSAAKHTCFVPVIDEFGRLAATPLGKLDFDEAWWALAGFPAAADDDDPEDGDDNDADSREHSTGGGGVVGLVAAYPVRQMMELVERLAERQTTVMKLDWAAWCARLEQTLSRVADSPIVDYFRKLGLNPLSPLWAKEFRPDYAENGDSQEGKLYEVVLLGIEAHWKTADLAAIGEGK